MPDFTSVFTQERDHWQGRAEAAEAEVERARATISEMLDENNRLDAERDQAMREVERLRGALDRPAIDANHIDRQRAFSEATFGPGSRLHGVTDHIAKELVEVREAAPNNLDEWVDVIILAFDGAWRTGANSQAIIDAIKAIAEALRRAEEQAAEHARAWALNCLAEQRRLAERCTFLYGAALAAGCTDADLRGHDSQVLDELDHIDESTCADGLLALDTGVDR